MLISNGNITLDEETVIEVLGDKENKMLHSEKKKKKNNQKNMHPLSASQNESELKKKRYKGA